ncbi:hypothetical protein ACLB2K_012775 [Fragaria x ananassa]
MLVVVPFGVQILTKCKSFNELLELSQVKTFEAVVGNSVVQLLWTTMIDGYAGWGNSSDAMELFDENGVEPNEVTMIAVLSACSSKGDVGMGKEMYVKCGCLAAAREVFDDRSAYIQITTIDNKAEPEREAIRAGMLVVIQQQIEEVEFEGDCAVILQALSSDANDLSKPRPPQPPQLLPRPTTHVLPAQPPPSRPRQLLPTATTPVLPAQPPPSRPRQLLPTATTPVLPAQPRPLLPTTTTHVLRKPVPLPREPTAQSTCFSYGLITAAKCCVICLEEFVEQDKCEMLTKCNHMYHHRCIKRWQATGAYCPLCRFKQEKEVSSSGGRWFGLRPEKQTGWVMKAPEFPTVGLIRSREEMDKNERPVLEGDTMEIDGGGGGVEAPTAKRQRRSDSADLMDIPIKEVFYIKEALMAPSNIKEIDSMNDSGEDSTAREKEPGRPFSLN